MNTVLFKIYECEIKTCTNDTIVCMTRNVHTVHEINNDGTDESKL